MITNIYIAGYKSIKEQKISLGSVNILLGSNGVGKSNFISVFSFIRNVYNKSLQNYIANKGGANSILHFGASQTKECRINIAFDDTNAFDSIFEATSEDKLLIKKITSAYKWAKNNQVYTQELESNVLESDISNNNFRQAFYLNQRLKEFDVYHFHDTGDNSPMKRKSNIDDNHSLKRDGSNIAAFLYLLKEKHINNFRRIEKQIQAIAPFFGEFNLNPSKLNESFIQLEWKDKHNPDAYFNASHLSDGTLRYICLVTLLMQPNPPKTIIIDEPELGLHPVAINKLAGLIRRISEKTQIIISTQSVNLIDNFDPEDIIITERVDNATSFKRLVPKELESWLKDYTLGDLWGKNIIGAQPYNQ